MPIPSFRFLMIPVALLVLSAGPVSAESGDGHQHNSQDGTVQTADTIWTCSMHPQIQLPEAGQCPICFMDLIEVEKENNEDRQSLRQISLDDRARKLARVEVQPVIRGDAQAEIRMVGKVDYDETRVGTITSWVSGRIDKLYVDYTGSHVRRGQAMAKVYSPELLTAQAELIQAAAALKRTEQSENEIIKKTANRTLEASREKLRLLGLGNKQLGAIEKQGKPTDHITLSAPLSGVVIKKDVNEGMYVKTGSPIYTLADLDRVWVILEAYESDLQAIALGQKVTFSVESYPGISFQGEVAYIDPLVDNATRTVRVRLNVDNRDAKLKPGMFVRAIAANGGGGATDSDQAPLLIPASAPLITGKRALVYVQLPDQVGVYVGREIVPGRRLGEYYQVKSGLEEGELVVTRGNFKIDSAIQLQGRPSMMNPYQDAPAVHDRPLPSLFISKLNLLNHTFAELSKAVHEDDPAKLTVTLSQLSKSVQTITGDKLEQEDHLRWQELSMLLSSDTILLQEAENRQETARIYATLAEHFHQLHTHFSLGDVAASQLGSPQLRQQIALLVTRYLELQQQLAADNPAEAHVSSRALAIQQKIVSGELRSMDFEQGNTLADHLADEVASLESATGLTALRVAFYPLSQTLAQVVETFGSADSTPLYIQFCPMAFGNTGATWLSATEEIKNPYFGAMMLGCGEIKKQLTL